LQIKAFHVVSCYENPVIHSLYRKYIITAHFQIVASRNNIAYFSKDVYLNWTEYQEYSDFNLR